MSIDLDPKTEHDLSELAGLRNMSVNALLREFTLEQKTLLERAGRRYGQS